MVRRLPTLGRGLVALGSSDVTFGGFRAEDERAAAKRGAIRTVDGGNPAGVGRKSRNHGRSVLTSGDSALVVGTDSVADERRAPAGRWRNCARLYSADRALRDLRCARIGDRRFRTKSRARRKPACRASRRARQGHPDFRNGRVAGAPGQLAPRRLPTSSVGSLAHPARPAAPLGRRDRAFRVVAAADRAIAVVLDGVVASSPLLPGVRPLDALVKADRARALRVADTRSTERLQPPRVGSSRLRRGGRRDRAGRGRRRLPRRGRPSRASRRCEAHEKHERGNRRESHALLGVGVARSGVGDGFRSVRSGLAAASPHPVSPRWRRILHRRSSVSFTGGAVASSVTGPVGDAASRDPGHGGKLDPATPANPLPRGPHGFHLLARRSGHRRVVRPVHVGARVRLRPRTQALVVARRAHARRRLAALVPSPVAAGAHEGVESRATRVRHRRDAVGERRDAERLREWPARPVRTSAVTVAASRSVRGRARKHRERAQRGETRAERAPAPTQTASSCFSGLGSESIAHQS